MREDVNYSVLMSLYKKEKAEYLRLSLDSMIHQTVAPDEIVLVEDGPLTDELGAVICEYQNRYPELFHIVINRANLGLGLALNKGLEACRNELVARMDTDDSSKSDRCEKQLLYFSEHPETAVLSGQIKEFISTPGKVVGKRVVPKTDAELKAYMKRRCPFNHMAVMFKKSDVLSAGNYQDWFCNEDYYLWIRMALLGMEFANLPDTLVNVRVGEDMYSRRGGIRYFKSEAKLQGFMLKKGMISLPRYLLNVAERLVLQVLMPNRVRGWVFRKFARESNGDG